MTYFEITFDTDDPDLRTLLAKIGRQPRMPERLRIEAAICQWWANRCLEEAGAIDGVHRKERQTVARARATREARKK